MAFSARRKRLSNALKNLELNWAELNVDPGLRADDVTVEQFIELAQWASANPVQG
jgi:16S rRNA A1518/A1519 N6-dimethyltransferase RsmA/KsgA/DIM1 with predicted DNA glycosylase/AP lyase activity